VSILGRPSRPTENVEIALTKAKDSPQKSLRRLAKASSLSPTTPSKPQPGRRRRREGRGAALNARQ
jgi:hypothetical protein